MSVHTFVTKSGVLSDDTRSVNILNDEDVRCIVDGVTKPLNAKINDLSTEIRNLKKKNSELQEMVVKITNFLIGETSQGGLDRMASIVNNGGCVLDCMGRGLANEKRLQKLPVDCRELFRDTIKEVLEPHYLALETETKKLLELKARSESFDEREKHVKGKNNCSHRLSGK